MKAKRLWVVVALAVVALMSFMSLRSVLVAAQVSGSQQQAPPEPTNVNATKCPNTGTATPATTATATTGVPITISVASGARQRFAGFGASMGNWRGDDQALPKA